MRWRADLDAVEFVPRGREAAAVVHRRAFRVLLGREPTPDDCLAFLREASRAFEDAARDKIDRARIGPAVRFHLTSRDLRRALTRPAQAVERASTTTRR